MNDIFRLFDKQWGLVAAADGERFNAMTISWGGLGTLWSRPTATVYVKPIRYTGQFLDRCEYFTISFFGEEHRRDLEIMGTLSGRDGDKLSRTELKADLKDGVVRFEDAECTLVCRKMYSDDLKLENIPDFAVKGYYTSEAPHRMYIGEVLDIMGKEMPKL